VGRVPVRPRAGHERSCPVRVNPGGRVPYRPPVEVWQPPPPLPVPGTRAGRAMRAAQLRAEGLSYRDIGAVLGCSNAQAWKLVNRPG
jgi:hypothetical protein